MMTAAEFWKQQDFSYLITYSFNRGPKLEALHEVAFAEIERVKQEIQFAPFRDQRKLAYQLRSLEAGIQDSITQKPLTTSGDIFDSTADKILVVQQGSEVAQQLSVIFEKMYSEAIHFMCLPIYRDAVAFYNRQGHLLSVLNICFECLDMRTDAGVMVEAGPEAYEALRELLGKLGHSIG